MTPIVNGLEAQYGDRIAFQRLNVDERDGKLAAQRYRVRGHPTIVLVDAAGEILWTRTGVVAAANLAAVLDANLNP